MNTKKLDEKGIALVFSKEDTCNFIKEFYKQDIGPFGSEEIWFNYFCDEISSTLDYDNALKEQKNDLKEYIDNIFIPKIFPALIIYDYSFCTFMTSIRRLEDEYNIINVENLGVIKIETKNDTFGVANIAYIN